MGCDRGRAGTTVRTAAQRLRRAPCALGTRPPDGSRGAVRLRLPHQISAQLPDIFDIHGLTPSGRHQQALCPPKPREIEHAPDSACAARSLAGHIVQVAVRVRLLQVDGGRDACRPASASSAGNGLRRARRAQHVAGHGLGGADDRPAGLFLAQGLLDGQRLRRVVERRAGAVGVDVDQLVRRRRPASLSASAHGSRAALGLRIGAR